MGKKKITLRECIDSSIFSEMEEKYPSGTKRQGMSTKQSVDHFSFPNDFDFAKFKQEAFESQINAAEAFWELCNVLERIAMTHGFWSEMDSISIKSDNLKFLTQYGYLASLNGRITSKYAVREYEISQSARKASRCRRTSEPTNLELDFNDFDGITEDFFE